MLFKFFKRKTAERRHPPQQIYEGPERRVAERRKAKDRRRHGPFQFLHGHNKSDRRSGEDRRAPA